MSNCAKLAPHVCHIVLERTQVATGANVNIKPLCVQLHRAIFEYQSNSTSILDKEKSCNALFACSATQPIRLDSKQCPIHHIAFADVSVGQWAALVSLTLFPTEIGATHEYRK